MQPQTLREVIGDKPLPFKVREAHWDDGDYFEVHAISKAVEGGEEVAHGEDSMGYKFAAVMDRPAVWLPFYINQGE